VRFLDGLERRGRVLDTQTVSYLPGPFFPSTRRVPFAYWGPAYGLAALTGGVPDYRNAYGGARAVVRVT